MTQTYDTELKLFINGSWRTGEGRDKHAVVNPATGDAIAALPLATEAAPLSNAFAKRLLAERDLEVDIMREVNRKKW